MRTRTFTVEVSSEEESDADFDKLATELFRAADKFLTTANPDIEFEIKVDEIE